MSLPVSPLTPVSDIQSAASSPVNNTSNNNGSNNGGSRQEQHQMPPLPPTPPTTTATPTQMKRKPSRRANTAERRATHNAVERQRRETLNGRFLVRSFSPLVFLVLNTSSKKLGPSFPPSEPFSNSTSFQIFHRQFFYSLHPRFSSSSSLGFPWTPSFKIRKRSSSFRNQWMEG